MEIQTILIDTTIAIKFKEFIEKHPVTFEEMSKNIGVSRSHLFRVLDGQRSFSNSLRFKLNTYLGTDY